jgi:hypothetical protein
LSGGLGHHNARIAQVQEVGLISATIVLKKTSRKQISKSVIIMLKNLIYIDINILMRLVME